MIGISRDGIFKSRNCLWSHGTRITSRLCLRAGCQIFIQHFDQAEQSLSSKFSLRVRFILDSCYQCRQLILRWKDLPDRMRQVIQERSDRLSGAVRDAPPTRLQGCCPSRLELELERHQRLLGTRTIEFDDHVFQQGEYVSIREHDGRTRTFKVGSVTPLRITSPS